jgi:hypothetical protein
MRLFEVDLGSARDVLAVIQGQADRQRASSTIPFAAVMNMLRPYALGINTPDGLIALKNKVDPAGDVIADVLDNGDVVLNTQASNPAQDTAVKQSSSPTVDKMAKSGAKKLSPDI